MVKFNYLLINLLLLINYKGFLLCQNSNSLKNVDTKVNKLFDELLFYFEKAPLIFYYKEDITNNNNNKIKEITFLIPDSEIKNTNKILKAIKNLRIDYKLDCQTCNKPINGIKIVLSYNTNKFYLEYGQNDFIIFFRLHKKNTLNLINQQVNTFRWYAKVENKNNYNNATHMFKFNYV